VSVWEKLSAFVICLVSVTTAILDAAGALPRDEAAIMSAVTAVAWIFLVYWLIVRGRR
jgi:hypothetical protein